MPGDARLVRQPRERGRLVDAVFRHVAVGGPLAPADRDQAGILDADGVVARERRGVAALAGAHQRPDAREHAEHVGARRLPVQVERRGLQDELDLLLQRHRLQRGLRNRRVGGAHHRVAVPRDGEHHAPVAGVRHHDGVVAGQERSVEHQVDALAGRDHRLRRRGRPARRTSSVNGPVALITTLARASNSSPVSASRKRTPSTKPSASFVSAVTSA